MLTSNPSVMSAHAAVELFLEHRRLKVKPASHALYQRWLSMWLQWRDHNGYTPTLHTVDVDELLAFFAYLKDEHVPHGGNSHRPAVAHRGLAPASRDSIWCVLRALWTHLQHRRLLLDGQLDYFRFGAVPRPKVPLRVRPTYQRDTLEKLIEACADDDREIEARNRAIIVLLYESGMRVSELCGLCDKDVSLQHRQAVVYGKGDKEGYVFWSDRGDRLLRRYLRFRQGQVGGKRPLFRGKNSRNLGGPLSADAVRSLMARLAERAGVELPEGAPVHAIRHTFAHTVLDRGGDGLHLQQLMRHESIETTQRYVRENPKGLRMVHRRIWRPEDDWDR